MKASPPSYQLEPLTFLLALKERRSTSVVRNSDSRVSLESIAKSVLACKRLSRTKAELDRPGHVISQMHSREVGGL